MIKYLNENEIFVFGSNLSGRHGAGAAKYAVQRFGAIRGQGEGLQGQSYAIPTRAFEPEGSNNIVTLSLDEIQDHVEIFLGFAEDNPRYTFLLTEVGCGLAGYNVCQIAPLFRRAQEMKNVKLPKSFMKILNDNYYVKKKPPTGRHKSS